MLITLASSGRLRAAAVMRVGRAREGGDVAAGAVLQHELEAAGGAESEDRRQSESEREGFGHLREAALRGAEDGVELRLLWRCALPRV